MTRCFKNEKKVIERCSVHLGSRKKKLNGENSKEYKLSYEPDYEEPYGQRH